MSRKTCVEGIITLLFQIGAGASERAVDGLLLANVLNGVGRGPDGTAEIGVVTPCHTVGIQKIGQRGMLEARILGGELVSLPVASII